MLVNIFTHANHCLGLQARPDTADAAQCQPGEERGEMEGPAHLDGVERCVARLITTKALEKAVLLDRVRERERQTLDASHDGDTELCVARLITSKAVEKAILAERLRVSEERASAAERAKEEVSSSIQVPPYIYALQWPVFLLGKTEVRRGES
jgi:hypothetical protein